MIKNRVVYLLTDIERLLDDVFAPSRTKPITVEVEKGIMSFLKKEEQKIINAFKQQFFIQENEHLLSRYFHLHQRGLIHVLDRIFMCQSSLQDSKRRKIVECFRATIESLLRLMEGEYSSYFNLNLKAPYYYFDDFGKDIAGPLSLLTDKLSKCTLDDRLREILTHLISEVTLADNFTLKKISFYRNAVPMLLKLDFDVITGRVQNEAISKVLLTTNYNANEFRQYYTDHFTRLFQECETLTARITVVARQIKIIQQVHVIPNVAWDHSAQDIKGQLLEWLTYELEYLRSKGEFMSSDKSNAISKDFKLKVDASVSQLSYLFRILTETQIIQNKNTSELIRFIAKFVSTKKSETISFDSFRLKYYNPETGTKDAVKNMLQKLQSYIMRN